MAVVHQAYEKYPPRGNHFGRQARDLLKKEKKKKRVPRVLGLENGEIKKIIKLDRESNYSTPIEHLILYS